jgi:dUTP pyrophosphatase
MKIINFEPVDFKFADSVFNWSKFNHIWPEEYVNQNDYEWPEKDFEITEQIWLDFWYSTLDPQRATHGSAGYDIYAPYNFSLKPGEEVTVPTGVKVYIQPGENIALFILPRSGAGFKFYTRLANTLGLIDSDYYSNANNDGHIYVKVRNESVDKEWVVKQGDAFAQGVFLPYFLTDRDNEQQKQERQGGLGSTN